MFTPCSRFQRLIFPFLFTVLTLVLASGCSDDDPTGPSVPDVDISGVVRNELGNPVPEATVYLGRDPDFPPMMATIVFDSVLADDGGRYVFDELDTTTYRVYAGVWGLGGEYFSLVSPFSRPLYIAAKSAGHIADLSLQEMAAEGVVTGKVFHDGGQSLVPADSATVILHRYEGAVLVVVDETATNADGRYVLVGVKTGNYIVTAGMVLNTEAPFPLFISAESEAFFCDGENLARVGDLILEELMVEKPAVYIYPAQQGNFQIDLELGPGVRLTASEPDYGAGWDVFVDDDGRIDATWDYLFYEIAMRGAPLIAEGWCLSWSELSTGLESITDAVGLTPAERDDFLVYWLSRLPRRDYYEIHPVFGSDLDAWVKLDVTPAPDAVLRFWMFFRGRDTAAELPAPRIPSVERTGTTVVEWGGAVIP